MHGALSWLPRNYLSLAIALALFCAVYALAARIILREEYGYCGAGLRPPAAGHMNSRRPLIIVSYHFAPSPRSAPSASAFSRGNSRGSGYEVHVITHEPRDLIIGRPTVAASSPARCIAAPSRSSCRSPARACCNARAIRAAALLAPVGLEYFWAAAATRKALEIARTLPPGVVIATSPPHRGIAGRREHRAATALAVDPRLSRSLERA